MAAVKDLQKSLVNFKLQSADRDLDVARNLLQQNIHLIELEDQEVIGLLYEDLEDIKSRLEKVTFRPKRWILNMHFKRVSKTTFMVIKDASDRAIDREIRNKLREATSSRGFPTSPPTSAPLANIAEQITVQPISPDSHTGHPSADLHPASTLTDAVGSNVDSMDMTALQSQTTGEPAVLLRLRRQDELPLHFVAAFSPDPPPDHGIAGEAETVSNSSFLHPQSEFTTSDLFGSLSDESIQSSGVE
ncbi:hypothetical protein BJY52DRAFT_1316627 [Lactarius psammicola]|nr:hypothetical protein BJY52DRAFT_1316627 [Lactarius psammicola]